ncbi:MAG: DUF898 family protein [Rhizobiales bacterium]|nr:DUF898 family protein [Hyphomicrobiales bacterium]
MTAVPGQEWTNSSAQDMAAAEASAGQPVSLSAATGAPGQQTAVTFSGEAGTLFPLLGQGFFLQVFTLGIYRFWLTTDTRRFYWSNTAVGTEAFAYTGTPMQLLTGFLFALAVLVPLQALGFFLILGLPSAETFITLAVAAAVLFLAQYAAYASRRYRLTRTSWRGLRLRMTGSAWTYAVRSFGFWLLAIVTLGLTYPWATAALERIKMHETFYGDAQGAFVGRPGELAKRLVIVWMLAILLPIFLAGALVAVLPWSFWSALLNATATGDPAAPYLEMTPSRMISAAFLFGPYIVIGFSIILAPAFIAITFRWRMSGMRIGGTSIASTFSAGRAYRIYCVGMLGVLALTALTAIPVVLLLADMAASQENTGLGAQIFAVVVAAAGYLAIFGAFWVSKQIFVGLPLYRAQMASLTVANLASLDDVRSRNVHASAMGEGLADAAEFGVSL